jgi:hypothetical protein
MHLDTDNGKGKDQVSPNGISARGIRQDADNPLKEPKTLLGFRYREPQPAARRCWARANIPELGDILRGHRESIAAHLDGAHSRTNGWMEWIGPVNQAQQNAGVEKYNH